MSVPLSRCRTFREDLGTAHYSNYHVNVAIDDSVFTEKETKEIGEQMIQANTAIHDERNGEALTTRERILRAAREVFETDGTRGTTTREVADRAGVNEATIFRPTSGAKRRFSKRCANGAFTAPGWRPPSKASRELAAIRAPFARSCTKE